jgi:putative CocE/NonD family hydrolase
VILVRTPYGRHQITKLQSRLVCRRGCGLVVQDVRGRFGSEGTDVTFLPGNLASQRTDGHDTVRWLARQSWCDGNVGTWGPSAMGIAQNLLAPGAPKALRAQHVMMAFSDMYSQAAYQGGAFRQALIEGWFGEHGFGGAGLQLIRAHPCYDAFWARLNPETQAGEVHAPGVFWGGWYDVFLQGTINSFVTIHYQGGPPARGRCRLILGPWCHDDIRQLADPRCAGCWPRAGDAFRFFAYWLQGACNGVPCDKPVHYYVMGDRCDRSAPGNFWRSAENWPPPAQSTRFYLHADGALRRTAPEGPDAELSYRYDPHDPVPTLGGQNLYLAQGPVDQRPVESRPDVLVFTTDALTQPLEVSGRIVAKLYVSSDCPDTDFTAKLSDVYPDGRSMLVCDGILRARFHESFEREEFLEPGKVYELTVDLWSTSIIFNKGHRIRVDVSSSNAPRFEPNPNSGGSYGDGQPPRIATNTLHLSSRHPSHVILPVYQPGAQSR